MKAEKLPHQSQHFSTITLSGYLTEKQNTTLFFPPAYQRSDIKGHQVPPSLVSFSGRLRLGSDITFIETQPE